MWWWLSPGDCHQHSSWQILSLCTSLAVTTFLQGGDIDSHWVLNLANHILYGSSGIFAEVWVDTTVNVNTAKCEAFSNSLYSITFGLQQCFSVLSKIWQYPVVGQPGEEVSEDWIKLHNWTTSYHIPFDHLTSWKNRQQKQLKPKCFSTVL